MKYRKYTVPNNIKALFWHTLHYGNVFQVCHSMRPPKPTCQSSQMSWDCNRLRLSSSCRKRKVRPCVCVFNSITTGYATSNPEMQPPSVCRLHIKACKSNLNCLLFLAWCYGERMRDGEKGWFPASCATEITNPTAMENNVQRMKRLRKETNV